MTCRALWTIVASGLALPQAAVPEWELVQAEPAESWVLYQNIPDPFCVAEDRGTEIRVARASTCVLEILILDPSGTRVVNHLVNELMPGYGTYQVRWNGRDDAGQLVPDGLYPYEVRATAGLGGPLLYAGTKYARVHCATALVPVTWERVKRMFE